MDGKKAKVQQKKVWKPKEAHLKEKKNNEDSKAPHAEVNKEPSSKIENSEKEGHGLQLDTIMPKQRIDDLVELSKQIVIYQRMEDQWSDLDEKIMLEEGEILAKVGNKSVEGDLLITQSREIKVFNPLNSQDDNDFLMNEPPPLEVVKENGENSKHTQIKEKGLKKRATLSG